MSSKVEDYTKNVLKVVVAQVCQIIGWNAINQSSLEVMVDMLHRFMQELTKQTYRITELYQRTEPTLDDLALAFHYLNVNLNDIKEYIEYVGPPDNVTAIPRYPAPPPEILNVKRLAEETVEPASFGPLQPKAEDSEDEEQFRAFAQYNREYKTQITGTDGTVEVKKENDGGSIGKSNADEQRPLNGASSNGLDSKQNLLKQAALARTPQKRKLTSGVQLTNGRIQGIREGRLPGADLPAMFLSEIEAASNSGLDPIETKPSKSKSHRHQDSNLGGSSGSSAFSSSSSTRREKLSQEPDRVKSNIFKKISHPHRSSPLQPAMNSSAAFEVIDIDSSPNPPPIMSPGLPPAIPASSTSSSASKREKKREKKSKEKHRDHGNSSSLHHQPQPLVHPQPDHASIASTLSSIPPLPAGTTLEAIPMKKEKEKEPPQNPNLPFPGLVNPFAPSAFFPGTPNFSLPQGPGLIPFGGNPAVPNLLIPPQINTRMPMFPQISPQLAQEVAAPVHSPKRKEKESKKQRNQNQGTSSQCNVAPLLPPNLFLPDTTVRMETVVKQEPPPAPPPSVPIPAPVTVPTPVASHSPIDLVTDEEGDPAAALALAAAARKAEKQKKKEQRRLEKMQHDLIDGGVGAEKGGDVPGEGKKDKASKSDRKMEKMLLKKMLKSKAEGGSDEPVDLSMLDQEQQRKLEKKLKKLQKSKKEKQKAEEAQAKEAAMSRSPEPLLLPKLTLKLNSPKVGEAMHSPKEHGESVREKPLHHSSKEYHRPLTVDTSGPSGGGGASSGDMMTPVKRVKSESQQNSPGLRNESLPVEPELAKISPLVTRPMKQQSHSELISPPSSSSSSQGRGRPKGSSNKMHSSGSVPPVIPVKEENVGPGNQVWICPACGSVDDGSPMIGCDGCDNWYHWLCVGIQVAPESSEDWFCRVCIMRRKEMMSNDGMSLDELAARKKEKKRKKKEKRMRMENSP